MSRYCKEYDGSNGLLDLEKDLIDKKITGGLLTYIAVKRDNPKVVVFGQTIPSRGLSEVYIEENKYKILDRHCDPDYLNTVKGEDKTHVYKTEEPFIIYWPDCYLTDLNVEGPKYDKFDVKVIKGCLNKRFTTGNNSRDKEIIYLSKDQTFSDVKSYFSSIASSLSKQKVIRNNRFLSYEKDSIREKFKSEIERIVKHNETSVVLACMGIGKGTTPVKVAFENPECKSILFYSSMPKVLKENSDDLGQWSDFDNVYRSIQVGENISFYNKTQEVLKLNIYKDYNEIQQFVSEIIKYNKLVVYSKLTGLKINSRECITKNHAFIGLKVIFDTLKKFDIFISDECDYASDSNISQFVYKILKRNKIFTENTPFIKMSATAYEEYAFAKSENRPTVNFSSFKSHPILAKNGILSNVNIFSLEQINKVNLKNQLPEDILNLIRSSDWDKIDSNQVKTLNNVIFDGHIKFLQPKSMLKGFGTQKISIWDKNLSSKNLMFLFKEISHCEKYLKGFGNLKTKNIAGQECLYNDNFYFVSVTSKYKENSLINKCQSDTEKVNDVLNKMLLTAKKEGKNVVVLSCGSLTRGSNVPDIDGIVVCKNIRAADFFEQLIGRLFRLSSYQKSLSVNERLLTHKTCLLLTDECLQELQFNCLQNIYHLSESEFNSKSKAECLEESIPTLQNSFFNYNTFLDNTSAKLYSGTQAFFDWIPKIKSRIPELIGKRIHNNINADFFLDTDTNILEDSIFNNISVEELKVYSPEKLQKLIINGMTLGSNSDLEKHVKNSIKTSPLGKNENENKTLIDYIKDLTIAIKLELIFLSNASKSHKMFIGKDYFPKDIKEFEKLIDYYINNISFKNESLGIREAMKSNALVIKTLLKVSSFRDTISNLIGLLELGYTDSTSKILQGDYSSKLSATPSKLIKKLYENIEVSNNLHYLGIACGTGTFEIEYVDLCLNKGYNIDEIAKDLYAFDSCLRSVQMTRINLYDKYIAEGLNKDLAYYFVNKNILQYNINDIDLNSENIIMKKLLECLQKASVIVGNPPYNGKTKDHPKLWPKFINLSLENNDKASIAMIVPNHWINADKNSQSYGIQDKFFERGTTIVKTREGNNSVQQEYFPNVGEDIGWFVNTPNKKSIWDIDNVVIDTKKLTELKNKNIVHWEKIVEIVQNSNFDKIELKSGINANVCDLKQSAGPEDIEIYYTRPHFFVKGNKYINAKPDNDFYKWKVIFNRPAWPASKDISEYCFTSNNITTGPWASYCIVKNKEEGESLVSYINTSLFKYILGSRPKECHNPHMNDFTRAKPLKKCLKNNIFRLPLLPLNKTYTDEDIFKMFNICEDDQNIINEQVYGR